MNLQGQKTPELLTPLLGAHTAECALFYLKNGKQGTIHILFSEPFPLLETGPPPNASKHPRKPPQHCEKTNRHTPLGVPSWTSWARTPWFPCCFCHRSPGVLALILSPGGTACLNSSPYVSGCGRTGNKQTFF